MKITKVVKQSRLSELTETRKAQKALPPDKLGWMARGPEEQKRMHASAQAMMRGRPPEVWLFDGKPVNLRFRNSEPEGTFYSYSYQQGNRWNSATAPAPGQVDLFARTGLLPTLKTIYEVIDLDGYTDKKTGKKMKNLARFLVVGKRLYEQIQALKKKYGTLTKRPFEFTRTGSGKTTAYMIIPGDPEPYDYTKVKSIAPDIPKYYSPPSEQEQRRILTALGKLTGEENNEVF